MPKVKVVTGYVPLANHPRSAAEYGALGEKIFSGFPGDSIHPFYDPLAACWLWRTVSPLKQLTHSTGDNPAKNSLAYHCVQHQKFAWLLTAMVKDPSADSYVWIDYGIGHVPGVTAAVIRDFVAGIREDDFAIPGCWSKANALINEFFPCWRFCGGVMVVPRKKVFQLYKDIKKTVKSHITRTGNLTWEVNSMAEAEKAGLLRGVRWYQADHNETLFMNYAKDMP